MSPRLKPPDPIGDYHIVQALGADRGLGRAYLALSRSKTGSRQKFLLKTASLDGHERTGLLSNIERLRDFRHPAAARVVDVVEHDDDLVLAFHTAEGLWLDQIIEHLDRSQERLSDPAIGHIGFQLLGALAEAHGAKDRAGRRRHLIHGELGPDRVLVSWGGEVLVYGIGLSAAFADAERSDLSRSFRAPEARHDEQGVRVPQGDLYVAAAMLWSLLTRRTLPADGSRPESLAALREDLAPRLTTTVDRALDPSAARRTVGCDTLRAVLRDELDGAAEARELAWNMDLFKALSLFSTSVWPQHKRNVPRADEASSAAGLSPPAAEVSPPIPKPRIGKKPLGRVTLLQSRFTRSEANAAERQAATIPVPPMRKPTAEASELDAPVTDDDPEPTTLPGKRRPEMAGADEPATEPAPAAPRRLAIPRPVPSKPAPPREAAAKRPAPNADVRTSPPAESPRIDVGRRFDGAEESVIARLSGIFDEVEPTAASGADDRPATVRSPSVQAAVGTSGHGAPATPAGSPHRDADEKDEADAVIEVSGELDDDDVWALAAIDAEDSGGDDGTVTRRSPIPPKPTRASSTEDDGDDGPVVEAHLPEPCVDDGPLIEASPPGATPQARDAARDEPSAPDDAAAPVRSADGPPGPDDPTEAGGTTGEPVAPPAGPPAPSQDEAPKRRRGVHPLLVAVGVIVVGAAAFAAAGLLEPTREDRADATPAVAAGPTTAPTPAGPAGPAPTTRPATADAVATATAVPVDAGAGGDAGEADARSEGDAETNRLPPVRDDLGGDGSELLSYEGYLIVRSRAKAEVFVQGVHRGPTNEKLKSRCHQKFVRLKDPETGAWLTAGRGVRIACMSTTTVVINP